MSEAKTIVRITTRENTYKRNRKLAIFPQNAVIRHKEKNVVKDLMKYKIHCEDHDSRFSEISTAETSQKAFVEEHVNKWIDGIFHGICQFVVVAGTEESGKNYLIKGSNSTPGIIPFLEKRLATLGAELALTSKVSYLRYHKRIFIYISSRVDTFWDILNPNRSSVSLQSSNDIYSFPSVKSVHTPMTLFYVASSLRHEECERSRDHNPFLPPLDLSRHRRPLSLDVHCIASLSFYLFSLVSSSFSCSHPARFPHSHRSAHRRFRFTFLFIPRPNRLPRAPNAPSLLSGVRPALQLPHLHPIPFGVLSKPNPHRGHRFGMQSAGFEAPSCLVDSGDRARSPDSTRSGRRSRVRDG